MCTLNMATIYQRFKSDEVTDEMLEEAAEDAGIDLVDRAERERASTQRRLPQWPRVRWRH